MTTDMTFAKLLLFGEYTILKGGEALACPTPLYGCTWKQSDRMTESGIQLQKLGHYLANTSLKDYLDIARFEQDSKEGWYLDSTIPQGYGLGSSGAVCAAVWKKYAYPLNLTPDTPLHQIKSLLAEMECSFHGTSSGTDPLVSFLNHPVLLQGDKIKKVLIPPLSEGFSFFLLDTGQPRNTRHLVQSFMERFEGESGFKEAMTLLGTYQSAAIQALLEGDSQAVFGATKQISLLQWQYLQNMIPDHIALVWEKSLESPDYAIKLCGAGGGGFLLGISQGKTIPPELPVSFI